MEVVNFTELRSNFRQIMDASWDQADTVLITRNNGHHMVMMPLPEYQSLSETQYLLQNPANAAHLKKSMASAQKDRRVAWVDSGEN